MLALFVGLQTKTIIVYCWWPTTFGSKKIDKNHIELQSVWTHILCSIFWSNVICLSLISIFVSLKVKFVRQIPWIRQLIIQLNFLNVLVFFLGVDSFWMNCMNAFVLFIFFSLSIILFSLTANFTRTCFTTKYFFFPILVAIYNKITCLLSWTPSEVSSHRQFYCQNGIGQNNLLFPQQKKT